MAPQFKYPCYVFAWYMSHVAPCMPILCVVIPHVVIPHVRCCLIRNYSTCAFYACCSMTISYMSGYYVYLVSSYVQARYAQLELLTYKIQSITVKEARVGDM